jgi:hypothetical protein
VKPSFDSSRGALRIGVECAERRTSAVGSTSRVWVKPQRIAGKLRQLARVTWASGAGGLPRMISVGRISILRKAIPTAMSER